MSLLALLLAIGAIITLSIALYVLLHEQLKQSQYRRKLNYRRQQLQIKVNHTYKQNKLYRHLHLQLASSQLSLGVGPFINVSLILSGIGLLIGRLYFTQFSSIILCVLVLAALPYFSVKFLLVSKRVEAQREFLPAIEMFYQCYLVTGGKQVKLALNKMVDEQQLMTTMQQSFVQLHRNLTLYPDHEYSLTIFSHATGHRFAHYFTQMLNIALHEGVSIKRGLKDLIDDMRRVRKSNENERHRLLEIRIANFTPLLFLVFFVGINMYINYEQSVNAYFYDEAGRQMILYAFVLIILSFVMGIHLSRRKMR